MCERERVRECGVGRRGRVSKFSECDVRTWVREVDKRNAENQSVEINKK